jgi:hypothetical protein
MAGHPSIGADDFDIDIPTRTESERNQSSCGMNPLAVEDLDLIFCFR